MASSLKAAPLDSEHFSPYRTDGKLVGTINTLRIRTDQVLEYSMDLCALSQVQHGQLEKLLCLNWQASHLC
jgi:hypothetical protein